LRGALADLIPAPWQLRLVGPIDAGQQLSWPSAPSWQQAVRRLAAMHDWNLRIDPDTHRVTLTGAWHLHAGKSIRHELTRWAKAAHWKVIWKLDNDWMIPADTTVYGAFKAAAQSVVATLYKQGVPIRATLWNGNKTLVLARSDVR
jgi:hypothetical protein